MRYLIPILLLGVWALTPLPLLAGQCGNSEYHSRGVVQQIHDGDTVSLKDGRRIRIIPIDAPEIDHKHPSRSQPQALAARDQLARLLPPGSEVHIRFDTQRSDKYGRLLAHLFTKQGENIAASLLQAGLARLWVIPPNDWNWRCYQQQQRLAQQAKRKIWRESAWQAVAAAQVRLTEQRLTRLFGRVTQVSEGGGRYWLTLDQRVTLVLEKSQLSRFPSLVPKKMLGQSLRVTGKLYQVKGQLRISLQHPWQLDS